ncbi:MAG: sigma-70 family RNA polymerase sigma factor [Firmicutes bacterium]|nr:sigma-70 family RNA polymerase sigma factor [Bacillota bacterium]
MSGDIGLLGKAETYQLIREARAGDDNARERLIRANTGLVKSIALKFTLQGHDLDDLMQVGFIGLIKAIDRFDLSYDVMFSTYAVPLILGELRRYLRDDGKIKIDRRTKQEVHRMRALAEEFHQKEGTSPRISQLAEQMGVDQERIVFLMEAQDAMFGMESLDDPEGIVSRTLGEHPERELVEQLDLSTAIASLPEQERKILLLRYFRDMTQQQIADRMGMSQVQVSRKEKKIMEHLRSKMKECEGL